MSTPVLIAIAIIILGDLVIFGFLWMAAAKSRENRPVTVGNGRIETGSGKPNYVSSLPDEEESNRIEPLTFTHEPETAWSEAVNAIDSLENTIVTTNTGNYLHAEAQSAFFKFVDDLELQLVPEEKKIHVKSASRVGHSDLGANRTRVEKIRQRFSGS